MAGVILLKMNFNNESIRVSMKANQKMKKTMQFVCNKFQITNQKVHFFHNGNELSEQDTVESANLKSDAIIDIVAVKEECLDTSQQSDMAVDVFNNDTEPIDEVFTTHAVQPVEEGSPQSLKRKRSDVADASTDQKTCDQMIEATDDTSEIIENETALQSSEKLQMNSYDPIIVDVAKMSELESIAGNILSQWENAVIYLDTIDSDARIELAHGIENISDKISQKLNEDLKASDALNLKLKEQMEAMEIQHTKEITALKEQFDKKSEGVKQRNQNMSNQLSKEIKRLQEEKKAYRNEVEHFKQCLKNAESEHKEFAQRQSIEIEQLTKNHLEKMDELRTQYSNATQLMEANQCQCMQKDIDKNRPLTPRSDSSDNFDGDAAGRVKELQRKSNWLQFYLKKIQNEHIVEIKNLNSTKDTIIKSHQEEVDELIAQINKLKYHIEEMKKKNASDHREWQQECSRLKEKCRNLNIDISQMQEQRDTEIEHYKTESDIRSHQYDRLEKTLARLNDEHSRKIEEIRNEAAQRERTLNGKLDAMTRANEKRIRDMDAMSVECERLKGELSRQRFEHQLELVKYQHEADNVRAEWKTKLAEMQTELSKKADELMKMQALSSRQNLERQLDIANHQCESELQIKNIQDECEQKLDTLKCAYAKKEDELKAVEARCDLLKNTLSRQNYEHQRDIEQIENRNSQGKLQTQNEWSGQFDEMGKDYAKKVEQLKTSYEKKLETVQEAHKKELDALRQSSYQLNVELKLQQEKHHNKLMENMQSLHFKTSEVKNLTQELDKLKQTHANDIQQMRTLLASQPSHMQQNLNHKNDQTFTSHTSQQFPAQVNPIQQISSQQSDFQQMSIQRLPSQNMYVQQVSMQQISTYGYSMSLMPATDHQSTMHQSPSNSSTAQLDNLVQDKQIHDRQCVCCGQRARSKITIPYCNSVCKSEYFKNQCLALCIRPEEQPTRVDYNEFSTD